MSCFPCSYCAFFDFAEINISTICPFGKVPKIKGKNFLALAAFSSPWKGARESRKRGQRRATLSKLRPGSTRGSRGTHSGGHRRLGEHLQGLTYPRRLSPPGGCAGTPPRSARASKGAGMHGERLAPPEANRRRLMGYLSTVPPRSSYRGAGLVSACKVWSPRAPGAPPGGRLRSPPPPPLLTGLCPAWSKHYIIEDVAMLL